MAIIEVDYGEVDGKKKDNGYVFTFNDEDDTTTHKLPYVGSTTANPYVIYGDFSEVKYIHILGMYQPYTNETSTTREYNTQNNVVLGNTYRMRCAKSSTNSYVSYRDITVYADRIEIGSGYYYISSYTEHTGYGGVQMLMLSNMAAY